MAILNLIFISHHTDSEEDTTDQLHGGPSHVAVEQVDKTKSRKGKIYNYVLK